MKLQNIKMINWCVLLILSFSIMACGGRMYHKQNINGVASVYYKDENGRKQVVYQINKDGSVTIYDEQDIMYQNYVAEQKWSNIAHQYEAELDRSKAQRARNAQKARIARIAAIHDAKKRWAFDPVYAKVHMPTIEAQDAKNAQKTAQRIHQAVTDQLSADKVLRVTSRKPDVEVFPKVYFKENAGSDKKAKKLVPVYVFYLEFNVRSNYLPEDNYTFEEHGHWFQNQQIVKNGTNRISKIHGNTLPKK